MIFQESSGILNVLMLSQFSFIRKNKRNQETTESYLSSMKLTRFSLQYMYLMYVEHVYKLKIFVGLVPRFKLCHMGWNQDIKRPFTLIHKIKEKKTDCNLSDDYLPRTIYSGHLDGHVVGQWSTCWSQCKMLETKKASNQGS